MATFVITPLKGPLLPIFPPTVYHPLVFGLLAVIGHTSIFAGFKGGKVVANYAGVIFGFAPELLPYLAIVVWKPLSR